MDALSDPRGYLSNQEKRAEQLKAMGIEESDISTEGVIVGGNKIKPLPNLPGASSKLAKAAEDKAPEAVFEPITPASLKMEKAFLKMTKKHQKEIESMRKKHMKERAVVQKNQCSAIDKLNKTKGKVMNYARDTI